MTKKEAIRRLENLALERGHKRNYYVKRALVLFLDRKVHLLGYRRTHMNGGPDPRRNLQPPEQVSALSIVERIARNPRVRGGSTLHTGPERAKYRPLGRDQ